jgi:hypothetical protein
MVEREKRREANEVLRQGEAEIPNRHLDPRQDG